ncbi:transmembrane protein 218 isoform X3 [Anser cygnoides]|uniref:transmembrane protein 218 isoform X3 n=1 Tax=Anser cygnoides TaxID=8845 RepID=UPI002009CEA2|nr:transmembrane protein 218 isoform X3 [Anser cygnoides]
MAGPVLGAGPGALLLAALWALALLLCLALARAPGAARLAALPVPVVAALLSAALLLYPREEEEEEEGAGPPPGTEATAQAHGWTGTITCGFSAPRRSWTPSSSAASSSWL